MDYLSLKAAVTEAGKRFTGRRVRETGQISPHEIVLRFQRETAVILSINPPGPGLFILERVGPLPDIRTPFSDLLNARVKGTTLKSLSLPEQGERMVILDLAGGWPARSGDAHRVILEVMGQHSNLSVLQGETILQPLKIVSSRKSRSRPVLPGERWKPPPQRPGTALEKITREDLPDPSAPEAVRELIQNVQGLSPYSAGQAVLKAAEGGRGALYRALTSMIMSADGGKGYLHHKGGRSWLAPFEPVVALEGETCETFAPFSAASAVWWEEGRRVQNPETDEKEQLSADLRNLEDRLHLTLRMLDRESERCGAHRDMRLMAETLLIHASEVRQGQNTAVLPNPYEPGKELTIPLDPSLSAPANADLMFAEAHRLNRGVNEVAQRRETIKGKLSAVNRSLADLLEKGDAAPAKRLLDEESGGGSGEKTRFFRASSGPGKKHTMDGFTILVGRSALDNERVTFQAAGPHDLWLHARDCPGSHVVILTEKKNVPASVLYRAAQLAAEGSGARNENAPEIMVTERKWVRKLKGGKPGRVTVERFRTIRPRIQNPESGRQKKT